MDNELLNILRGFNGYNTDMLYNDLIIIDKDNSDFTESEFNKFIIGWTLLHNGGLSYSTYVKSLNKISNVDLNNFMKLRNGLRQQFPDWIGIESPETKNDNNVLKIYLSVDNKDLHLFANQFMLCCLENGYNDYDFKINNNQRVNRRDNVVIYCNENNFGSYVSLVQSIIMDNPNIEFNSPHLLGIPFDDKIYCGIDFDDGKTSYTDRVCESIFKSLKNGKMLEEIVEEIKFMKTKYAVTINSLVEHTKKNR